MYKITIKLFTALSLKFVSLFSLAGNGLHMACGGFEALSCPPKLKLATQRKPCGQPFTRHKLYALLATGFFIVFQLMDLIYFLFAIRYEVQ
jgi:hypothetical protein